MGQSSSNSAISDLFPPHFFTEEVLSLTYEQLTECITRLNMLSRNHVDSEETYLRFVHKRTSNDEFFWKATVIIACLKIDRKTNQVIGKRTFSLPEFLKVFKTIMDQYSTAQESIITASKVFQDLNGISSGQPNSLDSQSECCICFERRPDMSLPCAHSYCAQCIERWKETNDTCPICRDTMESDEDWELTDIPKPEEIRQEIQSALSHLTERQSPPCSPV